MNNEPVAWTTDGKEVMRLDNDDDTLHAHPVKELTDEEIDQVVDEVWKANPCSDVEGLDINAFARAILRKAQE